MGSTYSFVNQTKNRVNVKLIDENLTVYRSFNTLNDNARAVIFEKLIAINNWNQTDVILATTNSTIDGVVQFYRWENGVVRS